MYRPTNKYYETGSIIHEKPMEATPLNDVDRLFNMVINI